MPAYFKYILKYCGFENGISIAKIDDNDIPYFIQEVKNENVSNYFQPLIGNQNVLEGSNKTTENFEFSRGHLKYLMYIVRFLKNYVDENGVDCFSLEQPPKCNGIKRPIEETVSSSRKRMKHAPTPDSSNEHIVKQEGILLGKTIMSVIMHTSQVYVKVSVTIKLLNLEFNEACANFQFV